MPHQKLEFNNSLGLAMSIVFKSRTWETEAGESVSLKPA